MKVLDTLVAAGGGERGSRKADTLVGGVKYAVEALQECISIDEVKAVAAGETALCKGTTVRGDTKLEIWRDSRCRRRGICSLRYLQCMC